MLRLAVIGMGGRSIGVCRAIRDVYPQLKITGIIDTDPDSARERLQQYELTDNDPPFFSDIKSLLERADQFDGLLIGTRCNTHTPIAIQVSATGLPLFLEKPVAISYEQLNALRSAYRGREKSVVVSFPLRFTPLFTSVVDIVRSGKLGSINQVQAVNNVSIGGVYFSEPYREYDLTGGLWLQKATHDFDYINNILGQPTMITAMMSRIVFGGDMPHDLHCADCDMAQTCWESPQGVARRGDDGGVGKDNHPCVFGNEIKNQDAGSAIIYYHDASHASYSQNFVTRRSAVSRGAIITGYKATLEFNWYTEEIQLIHHHTNSVERHTIKVTEEHYGGDHALARNFVDVCLKRDDSHSSLTDGLLSAAMCLAARDSAHKRKFITLGDIQNDPLPFSDLPAPPVPVDIEPVLRSR